MTHEQPNITSFEAYLDLTDKYPLEQYKKLASILLLKKAGLPTLPGFVVTKLDEKTIQQLAGWAESNGSRRLSLRFDSPIKGDHIRLSSLNPSTEDLKNISHLISPPVIGLFLAENDRFKQGHSIVTQFLDDRLICEVVGPGFDAGDLTRGNITPHETIVIGHKGNREFDGELSPIDILSHRLVSWENYLKSCKLRRGVIYSYLSQGLGKSVVPEEINKEQEDEVDFFLANRKAEIPDSYQPLDSKSLSKFYAYISPLDSFREHYKDSFGLEIKGKVLSASFLLKYGLVFWDFYDGKKYERGNK